MKKIDMAKLFGNVSDKFVSEADGAPVRNNKVALRWLAAAACLCIAVTAAALIIPALGQTVQPGEPDADDPVINAADDYAFHIPAIELYEPEDGIAMDMVGCVVYKGQIYTQTTYYSDEDNDNMDQIISLIGECVGNAKGNLSEWSTQEDYALELASTYTGEVYSVKGYSDDFRLCMPMDYTNENGEYVRNVVFLDNLNGIGFTFGKDIFGEKRLNIKDRIAKAEYVHHNDWNNNPSNLYNYTELSGEGAECFESFIDELYEGRFEYVYEFDEDFYFRGADEQSHIFLTMQDGTTVELRLFKGGYVGYQGMGWYFVKIPGESFDKVFAEAN